MFFSNWTWLQYLYCYLIVWIIIVFVISFLTDWENVKEKEEFNIYAGNVLFPLLWPFFPIALPFVIVWLGRKATEKHEKLMAEIAEQKYKASR